ncbi:MAG: hypothetical protein WAV00_24095 [Nocardioides sp.]
MSAATAFALAAALHAGFQLTVTVLVYPALASRTDEEWSAAHTRHTRAITPLVGAVYGALVVTGVALVRSGPGPAAWVALLAEATAMALTATVAAPIHGRLSRRDEPALARLLRADRGRCAAAVVGLVAAVASVTVAGLE